MRVTMLSALWLGALVLVPSGAHVLEMVQKMALAEDAYFTVQRLYTGWALFGVAILAKVGVDLVAAILLLRGGFSAGRLMFVSAGAVTLGLAVFFVWVQPANIATANWTTAPETWDRLRRAWEYGHLAIAGLTVVGVVATTLAATRIPWQS